MNNEDEDSLFIPALRRVSNRYVRLQPGERFNFVYEVVPKGVFSPPKSFDPAHLDVDFSSALPTKTGGLNDTTEKQQQTEILPRLANDLALESAVAISWRVEGAVPKGVVRVASAVRSVAARWNPHALAAGVVVALSGPRSVTPRAICDVHVTVRNQRSTPLERAVLCVRKNSNRPRPSLTPLRTAVALGRVAPGHVARVTVWAAPKPFEVLVADPIVVQGATKLVSAGTTAEAATKLVSAGSSAEATRL